MKYCPREILNSEGALLTSELANKISRKHQVGFAAAKKGIERAYKKGTIKRIEFMAFGRGERLYYTASISQSDLLTKVLSTIKDRRPIIHRLWKVLQKEIVLSQRDGLKITGLPTRQLGRKESYKDIVDYLTKLGLAYQKRIIINQKSAGFIILNGHQAIAESKLGSYAAKLISQEQVIQSYLSRAEATGLVKKVKARTQVGRRIFDAIGEAVSRRHMLVVFDFNLTRTTEDYDIEGLLDRIYSVFRKKFKQVVITYCISKEFTKAAQRKAMTGRFSQINLIQVKIKNGQMVTKKIDGISRQSRGEFFENQIRYILRRSGFQDVQRGLKVYKNLDGLTEKPTPKEFSDIDIIANSKNERKIIVCELKNWNIEVPQKVIEGWVQSKLNHIVDFLQTELDPRIAIEAWYIVSKKQQGIDVVEIRKKCRCDIRVYSKLELINDVLSKIDPLAAKELRPIILQ